MRTTQRRLEILADALSVRPNEVVSTLRRKNLGQYVDAQGATLVDLAWSDAELVDAAYRVFIEESTQFARTEAPEVEPVPVVAVSNPERS